MFRILLTSKLGWDPEPYLYITKQASHLGILKSWEQNEGTLLSSVWIYDR